MTDKYPYINRGYIKNENKLKSTLETWYEQGMGAKFFYMKTWLQNINFHAGNQWLTYDEHKQMFENDPNSDDEIRLTINKILPAVRMAVGKIIQDRKRAIMIQRTQDEESIESAKVGTQYLEHQRRISDGLHIEKELATWATLTGKGYTKKWFDAKTEDICTDVIPPFEVVTPPNVLKAKKFPWICHARFETREWLYEKYGLDRQGSSDWGQYGMFLSAVKNVMEDGNYTGVYTQGLEDNVMVKEWWIRPCKDYPDGALIIEVNDEIIFADRNPYVKESSREGKVMAWKDFYWPFAEFDFFDAPYRYWPISLVELLVDMNKWINETYSNNLENMQYANSPTTWAQEGTVVAEEVDRKPGSVNFFTGQVPPREVVTQSFDPSVFNQMNILEQAISELAGIHFFGPGSMPPGVHAAAALAIINEQDQIASMSVSTNHEKWMIDDARQTLYLLRAWGPDKMLIRVMGDEGEWEVVEFKKSFLTGEEELKIESKSELAQDKLTKLDQVIKLATTPGDDGKMLIDTEQALRMLNLEKDAGIVTPRMLNRNMAMSENQKLWKGAHIEVYSFEDHKAHMECHLEEMLTVKFKEADKEVQNTYIQHYQDHATAMNSNQQQASSQVGQSEQQPMMPTQMPAPMMPQQPMSPMPQMPMAPHPMMQPMAHPMPASGLAQGLQSSAQRIQQTIHPGG